MAHNEKALLNVLEQNVYYFEKLQLNHDRFWKANKAIVIKCPLNLCLIQTV